MRSRIYLAGILTILATPLVVHAQQPPLPKRSTPQPVPPVISTHQIDRYDAINKLQQSLKENPKSLADWVILGELAHEVALDLPGDQAVKYYRMSRDAYQKALELSPDNPGLKAAVQFAKDQETNAERFESTRDQAATAYLDARRRDLAATNYTPSLRVYGAPAIAPYDSNPAPTQNPTAATNTSLAPSPGTTINPTTGQPTATTAATTAPVPPTSIPPLNPVSAENAPAGVSSTDPNPAVTPGTSTRGLSSANYGTQQFYSYPTYQPYYIPQGSPYTFQQYSRGYYPSSTANTATPLMSVQRYYQQLPRPTSINPVR